MNETSTITPHNDWSISGKRVLITGAGSGIGREMADTFFEAGARVVGMDRDMPHEAPLGWELLTGDVTDEKDIDQVFERSVSALGGLDAVIANAGVRGKAGPVEEWSVDEWDEVMKPNVTGVFLTARAAVRAFKPSGQGRLVLMSSGAGRMAYPMRSAYAASKWAVVGLAKTLAAEQGKNGIAVNAILPGLVRSPGAIDMLEKRAVAEERPFEDVEAEFLAKAPLGGWVEIADIVNAARYLCSEAGARTSGLSLTVDAALYL
jgi:NAD(P)-dependent dehydrogenase (short-subunit alcohol dehydrogenase family)